MTKTEIENKIHDLKRTIKSCENIIKANEKKCDQPWKVLKTFCEEKGI